MAAIPPLLMTALVATAAAGATVAAGSMLSPKPKAIKPLAPQPTRIEARDRAERSDILSRRTGTGANRRVGFGAGEAATGQRRSLLGRV